jgi:hypothetical protein
MMLEREMLVRPGLDDHQDIRRRLEAIEQSVNALQLPLAFADQLYVLREHIAMVRARFDALPVGAEHQSSAVG